MGPFLFAICFRVLKPPGGGSSDIFGTANGSAASTARSVSKNHVVSNIFGAPQNRNGKSLEAICTSICCTADMCVLLSKFLLQFVSDHCASARLTDISRQGAYRFFFLGIYIYNIHVMFGSFNACLLDLNFLNYSCVEKHNHVTECLIRIHTSLVLNL